MTDTYPIQRHIPPEPEPVKLDLDKLRASIGKLDVGGGFVIPAIELKDAEGVFRSTKIGQRIYRLARSMGVRVSTTKLHEGLRVRREE